jgi:hypothetical protein
VSIEAVWLDETKTAVIYTFTAGWTWNDFTQRNKLVSEMLDTVNYKVDIILDFTVRTVPPPNALSNFQRLVKGSHPNRGRLILVGGRLLFRAIAGQFIKLSGKLSQQILMVETLEEARKLVEVHRQKSN